VVLASSGASMRVQRRSRHIVDGDTFDLRTDAGSRTRIRFCGVDSPERGTPG